MLQEAANIKNTVVLIFRQICCLHLMYSEVAWIQVSLGSQVHLQIILDPDYLPHYFSVFYDFDSGCGLVNLTMFLSAFPGLRLFIQSKVQGKRSKIVTWVILEHS